MKIEQQKWIVAEENDYIHVVPDNDSRPHADVLTPMMGKFELAKEDCLCKPTIKLHDDEGNDIKPMIIHNSFIQQELINKSMSNMI